MTFQPSARMIARRRTDVDVASLLNILSYRRCYNTDGELEFLEEVIGEINGIQWDDFGNAYIRIPNEDGSQSDILWSCHTDSVHSPKNQTIRQNLKWEENGNIIGLNQGKPGQCLGADDGCGIWLMMEMLDQGKPGLYVFHRAEEVGGQGSRWIAKNNPDLLKGINYAIAFDRKDLSSIITHQGGSRCCSDAFGLALGAALSRTPGINMKLDQTGSFTDTAVYVDVVPECTNVSVGYYNQHGPRETLDVMHMIRLRDALMQLNPAEDFVVERVAGTKESRWANYSQNSYSRGGNKDFPKTQTTQKAKTNVVSLPVVATEKSPSQLQMEAHNRAWKRDEEEPDAQWYAQDSEYAKWLESRDEDDTVGNEIALLRMVKNFPSIAVELLLSKGVTPSKFADATVVAFQNSSGAFGDDPDGDLLGLDDDVIDCENCKSPINMDDIDDDLRCPLCYASLMDAFEEAIEAQDAVTLEKIDDARCL